ncbi:calponin homology domain-containing protein DDB_G0272472-like [Sabethes cyaneus]|uniref:calponin homology domain-containing protein DDB_G0272472-like n=1 Tax=Sabethes cyaneus TaxID=53552 RepID=UPI00237EA3E1|nr:calponin homology domain-containing protein DDB_G0272472-like [Sabethes cyaneus]
MCSRWSDRLQRKITDLILFKNRQLRSFSRLLLNSNYLQFAQLAEDNEIYLEDLIGRLEENTPGDVDSVWIFPVGKINHLCLSKERCIRKLEAFERICWNYEDLQFKQTFFQRLSSTENSLRSFFQAFINEVEDLIQQLPEISLVADFQSLLRQTSFLHLIVLKNHANVRNIISSVPLKTFSAYSTANLKIEVLHLFQNLLLRYLQLLDEMDSSHSSSLESVRDKLNLEITRSRSELVIQEAEVAELRQEMFPTSEVSLKVQRDAAIDRMELKELDLEVQIRTIDGLQSDIQGLEYQVAKLIEERQRVQEQLAAERQVLRVGIREVVRLERLIEKIEKEISDRMQEFQEKLEALERKRLAILEDETLTVEERARLMAELEQEIGVIRDKFEADQQLLTEKCEELKQQSKSVTEDLDAFKDELVKKHLDEIRELEEMKKNATPSELELINAKIAALEQEFAENLEMLDRAKARVQYFEDEFGRYYINAAGQKVYKRDTEASEYILTEDGEWVKIREGVTVVQDEKGEFYIDNFGNKIYTKKYFQDEYGRYYIDSAGNRIYLEEQIGGESSLSEPELAGEASKAETVEESVEEATPTGSDMNISDEVKEQRASDIKYIQGSVGVPLRKGLALAFLYQPSDPIEFLAKFLEKYHNDQTAEEERNRLMKEVVEAKKEIDEAVGEDSREDICQ